MNREQITRALAAIVLCSMVTAGVSAADWPMWRYDANRSGASPHELSETLHLQWVREYPPQARVWLESINQQRMPYDKCYEPIAIGQTLLFGSARNDALVALDTRTGAKKWRFHANGPIRLAPVGYQGCVYIASDDGYLYCLDVEKGTLRWRFRGGPSERKVLGNGRLISMWPARGGPVIVDGVLYFAASIWPFMGVFVHALDAETGSVIWTNDGCAPRFMMQIKRGPAFDGPAPQGAMAVVGDRLVVPCGRSVPACFDRRTGKLLYYHVEGYAGGEPVFNTKTNFFDVVLGTGDRMKFYDNNYRRLRYVGGSYVCGQRDYFLNSTFLFDLASGGDLMAFPPKIQMQWDGRISEPPKTHVLTEDVIYASGAVVQAYDAKSLRPVSEEAEMALHGRRKKAIPQWQINTLWTGESSWITRNATTLIKAGNRLYVGTPRTVCALDLTGGQTAPKVSWHALVQSTPASLLAADSRLFVVTEEGALLCYGSGKVEAKHYPYAEEASRPDAKWLTETQGIIDETGVTEGYALAFGVGTGGLVEALALNSGLQIFVIEPDADKANRLRRRFDSAGEYGTRISILVGEPKTMPLPPYLASLIVSEDPASAGLGTGTDLATRAFHCLRPYGGAACLPIAGLDQRAFRDLVGRPGFENARVRVTGRYIMLSRDGAPHGSANWTHAYCDAAKRNLSEDQLVKLPLGLLWFGGSSHEGVLPRHGCGPVPHVVDGRLFIEGPNGMRGVDVYTGRVLWEASLPGVGLAYDSTHHQPAVRPSGGNYASTSDGIYVSHGKTIVRLDPVTGRRLSEFALPPELDRKDRLWGAVSVWQDLVIAGVVGQDSRKRKSGHDKFVYFSSEELAALNRHDGRLMWRFARGFSHVASAVGRGRVFCVAGPTEAEREAAKRRGEQPKGGNVLYALDARSGEVLWDSKEHAAAWLSYSEQHDLLLVPGVKGPGAVLKTVALRGSDGSVVWDTKTNSQWPLLVSGDMFFAQNSRRPVAYSVLTGKPVMRDNPLTGKLIPLKFTIPGDTGCSEIIGGPNLLTFRACSAGYFDLHTGGSGNFGGFRASCTSNLIPACGVLNCPDYTRTCMCMYQNQCSLALVHLPEVETWSEFDFEAGADQVKRVGINFGAPGDRLSENGTLWLDYPSVGGRSPDIPVTVVPDGVDYFRRHSTAITNDGLKWVASSGCHGVPSISIRLAPGAGAFDYHLYTVRLYFAEMGDAKAGQRVFTVKLQGNTVLKRFDIVRATGGPRRSIVKEFRGIQVKDALNVAFVSVGGAKEYAPMICGIEAISEEGR